MRSMRPGGGEWVVVDCFILIPGFSFKMNLSCPPSIFKKVLLHYDTPPTGRGGGHERNTPTMTRTRWQPLVKCNCNHPVPPPALPRQLAAAICCAAVAARSLQSARLLLAACNLLSARDGTGGGSLQHLYAVIAAVAHDDAALAVDQNAVGIEELPISTASAADGSHVTAVTVA